MISFNDYQKADGNIDWSAYHNAQIAQGERCYECTTFIAIGKGYKSKCYECQQVSSDARAITHSSLVRCPKCQHTMDAHDSWEEGIYSDGEHEITCYECEYEFKVETYVSYSFKSPALIAEEVEA